MLLKNYCNYLLKLLPLFSIYTNKTDISLIVFISHTKILEVLTFLKYHTNCQYKIISDLCVIDNLSKKNRFSIVYNLLSIQYNSRIRIKFQINEFQTIPSGVGIFRCLNWWEREAWDMFGIFFLNHPDLRRILTDYGFEGYPLRKDFPLTGFVEVRYDELKKRIVYEPISIMQNFRSFKFNNSWS